MFRRLRRRTAVAREGAGSPRVAGIWRGSGAPRGGDAVDSAVGGPLPGAVDLPPIRHVQRIGHFPASTASTPEDLHGQRRIRPVGHDPRRQFGRRARARPRVRHHAHFSDFFQRGGPGGNLPPLRRDPFHARRPDRPRARAAHRSRGLGQGADLLRRNGVSERGRLNDTAARPFESYSASNILPGPTHCSRAGVTSAEDARGGHEPVQPLGRLSRLRWRWRPSGAADPLHGEEDLMNSEPQPSNRNRPRKRRRHGTGVTAPHSDAEGRTTEAPFTGVAGSAASGSWERTAARFLHLPT